MPHLVIYGMRPMLTRQTELTALITKIQLGVAGVAAMQIEPGWVTVHFPADQCLNGLGEELIVHNCMNNTPDRTEDVVGAVHDAILDCLEEFVREQSLQTQLLEAFLPGRPGFGMRQRRRIEGVFHTTIPQSPIPPPPG